MAAARSHPHPASSYPGPTRQELGSLAEWVIDSELTTVPPAPTPRARLAPVSPKMPRRAPTPKPYSGPTPEELRALGDWAPEAPRSKESDAVSESSPSTSIRGIESELWVAEMTASLPPALPKAGRPTKSEPLPDDPFLETLDEIELALQKRAS